MKDKVMKIIYKRYTGKTVRWGFLLILLILIGCSSQRKQQLSGAKSGLSVSVDQKTGGYVIRSKILHWDFKGHIGKPLSDVTTSHGRDAIGPYGQISFRWKSDNEYRGVIRRYNDKPVVVFMLTTLWVICN